MSFLPYSLNVLSPHGRLCISWVSITRANNLQANVVVTRGDSGTIASVSSSSSCALIPTKVSTDNQVLLHLSLRRGNAVEAEEDDHPGRRQQQQRRRLPPHRSVNVIVIKTEEMTVAGDTLRRS